MSQLSRQAEVVVRKLVLLQLPAVLPDTANHCERCKLANRVGWDAYYHLVSNTIIPTAVQRNMQIHFTHKRLSNIDAFGMPDQTLPWTAYEHTLRVFDDERNDYLMYAGVRITINKAPHEPLCLGTRVDIDNSIRTNATREVHELHQILLTQIATLIRETSGIGFTVIDQKVTHALTVTKVKTILGQEVIPEEEPGYIRRTCFLHRRDDIIDDRTPEAVSPEAMEWSHTTTRPNN